MMKMIMQFDANICAIVVGVIQVTGTSLSVLVVDKFGRRKLLIISEFFICISFCLLSSFFFIQVKYINENRSQESPPRSLILPWLNRWPGSL